MSESFFARRLEPWVWLDPCHKLTHATSKCISKPLKTSVKWVWYVTRCGHRLTVDDINAMTKVQGYATCLACVVAIEEPNVIQGEE